MGWSSTIKMVTIAGSFAHLALVWQRDVDSATLGPAMGKRCTAHLLVDLHNGQRNAKE